MSNWEPQRVKEEIGPEFADVVDSLVETGKNILNDLKDGKFELVKVGMQSAGDLIEAVVGGGTIPGEIVQAVQRLGVPTVIQITVASLHDGVLFYFPEPEPGLQEDITYVLDLLHSLANLVVHFAVKKNPPRGIPATPKTPREATAVDPAPETPADPNASSCAPQEA